MEIEDLANRLETDIRHAEKAIERVTADGHRERLKETLSRKNAIADWLNDDLNWGDPSSATQAILHLLRQSRRLEGLAVVAKKTKGGVVLSCHATHVPEHCSSDEAVARADALERAAVELIEQANRLHEQPERNESLATH